MIIHLKHHTQGRNWWFMGIWNKSVHKCNKMQRCNWGNGFIPL